MQFGKFVDHFAQQIGFGQHRRPLGQGFELSLASARLLFQSLGIALCQSHGDLTLAHAFVKHRPQSVHKDDLFESFGIETAFEIVFVKEHRVGQTGLEHPLVTGDDLTEVVGIGVGDDDEGVVQLAILKDGEVALMLFHAGHDHFRRQFQKALVKTAHQRRRPLGDRHDLLHQLVVPTDLYPFVGFDIVKLGQDLLPPPIGEELHAPLLQDFEIGFGRFDFNGIETHLPMYAGFVTAANPKQRHGHHLLAQHRDDPAHRADELRILISPAHHLSKTHRCQPGAQHLLQEIFHRLPGDGALVVKHLFAPLFTAADLA